MRAGSLSGRLHGSARLPKDVQLKLRNGAPRWGGSAYYQLIGSVHEGQPVMPGDTYGSDSYKRDKLLRKYAGAQQPPGDTDHGRQDPTEPKPT